MFLSFFYLSDMCWFQYTFYPTLAVLLLILFFLLFSWFASIYLCLLPIWSLTVSGKNLFFKYQFLYLTIPPEVFAYISCFLSKSFFCCRFEAIYNKFVNLTLPVFAQVFVGEVSVYCILYHTIYIEDCVSYFFCFVGLSPQSLTIHRPKLQGWFWSAPSNLFPRYHSYMGWAFGSKFALQFVQLYQ